jgi:mono/diheme cytochrome c family protein
VQVPGKTRVSAAAAGAAALVFANEIQPVLERSCIECHGPKKIKGRLRLDTREAALAGGRSGRPAIKPGQPEASELLRRVRLPRDDDEAMPSSDDPGLSAAEIAALEKWIADGAVWH